MKIKSWHIFLIVIPFLLVGSPSFAADCAGLKNAIKAERNLKKRRTLVADAIHQCPEDPVLNYKYGLSLERFRKYDKALSYYHKAALYDPKMAKAYAAIGDVHVYQGLLDKAIDAYRKAVNLIPGESRTKSRLDRLEAKRKALHGGILTVADVITVMDHQGKISANMPLLLTGPVLQYQITFAVNSNDLLPTGIRQLAGIGQAMQNDALQHAHFEISAHMESAVSSLDALENSKIRVHMIKDQLVTNFQIDPKRLEIAWHGDTLPLDSGEFSGGRSLNNRVEFKRIIE